MNLATEYQRLHKNHPEYRICPGKHPKHRQTLLFFRKYQNLAWICSVLLVLHLYMIVLLFVPFVTVAPHPYNPRDRRLPGEEARRCECALYPLAHAGLPGVCRNAGLLLESLNAVVSFLCMTSNSLNNNYVKNLHWGLKVWGYAKNLGFKI